MTDDDDEPVVRDDDARIDAAEHERDYATDNRDYLVVNYPQGWAEP